MAGRSFLSWQRARPFVTLLLFVLALALLRRELAGLHYHEVTAYLAALPAGRLALAALLTAASYAAMTAYEALGLADLGKRLPYAKSALASFVGYALSNTLGFPLLTGIPLRVRLYSKWGLTGLDVTRLVLFCFLSFWLGFAAVAGAAFTLDPFTLPVSLGLPFAGVRPLGVLFLLAVAGYLFLLAGRRRPLTFRGTELPLPGLPVGLGQTAFAALDWLGAAGVLYVLLAAGHPLPPAHFLGVFLLAQLLGIVSQLPGGLGVFESAVVLLLAPTVPPAVTLGALVAYRAVYYLAPLFAAALLLAGYEVGRRRHGLLRRASWLGRLGRLGVRMPAIVPQVLAATTFLGGVVLLVSGATPAVPARLHGLTRFLPLPVVETSHFVGSLVGVALLLLARGIQRRLDVAYPLTVALLAVGIAVSLLKGLDFEEALLLSAVLVALLPCRRHFYRRAALTAGPFTPGWTVAVLVVLLGVAWLGFFCYRHVEYSNALWWGFSLHGNAPRFLRAMVGATILALVFALAHLLRAAPPKPAPPSESELERATEIAARVPRTYAHLALLGDKRLLWAPGEDGGPPAAFVMYAVAGRSWVAMGDPVGPEGAQAELAWRFHELVDEHGGATVFYQVAEARLHLYVDLGLSLVKLGEEARVPLARFALAASAHKKLRHAHRRCRELGCRFEVVAPEGVAPLLPELAAVSEDWLGDRGTREKTFSLGSFAPGYLRRLPLALVRGPGGEIAAFANLWLGAAGEEMSVDLMRHRAVAAPGRMDFLFVELLSWGREQGYAWFNLGMAPLSGLAGRAVAPLWDKLGTLLFHHGEAFYNFQGLRHYKDKFDPVWESRYLAYPGGFALPRVLADVASLVSGGFLGVFVK